MISWVKLRCEYMITSISIVLWRWFYFYQLIEADWRMPASLNYAIIGSDNGAMLLLDKSLLIGPFGTHLSEIWIKIQHLPYKNWNENVSAKLWPFCLGLNGLTPSWDYDLLLWISNLFFPLSLRWRHNDNAGVSNHQPHGCLLNRLFRRKSKKTSKLRVTGLCVGNSPGTGEFPAQMASYAENVSIWWRHHVADDPLVIVAAKLAYDTTAVLSWDVQNFVAIWPPITKLKQSIFYRNALGKLLVRQIPLLRVSNTTQLCKYIICLDYIFIPISVFVTCNVIQGCCFTQK